MKAEELRIGNWVHSDEMGEPMQVNAHQILFQTSLKSMLSGFIDPIPLTEEWLVDFGFNYENGAYYLNNIDDSFYVKYCSDEGYGFSFCATTYGFLKEVPYVHQLQNLYHSLTGTELSKSI